MQLRCLKQRRLLFESAPGLHLGYFQEIFYCIIASSDGRRQFPDELLLLKRIQVESSTLLKICMCEKKLSMSQLTKAEGNENIRVTQSIQMMATQSSSCFSFSFNYASFLFTYMTDKTIILLVKSFWLSNNGDGISGSTRISNKVDQLTCILLYIWISFHRFK